MRVNNVYLTNVEVGQPETAQKPKTNSQLGQTGQAAEKSSHVPSQELTRLLEQLRQTPEVREEKIQEIQKNLLTGYYLSAEAAEKTATAIVKTSE